MEIHELISTNRSTTINKKVTTVHTIFHKERNLSKAKVGEQLKLKKILQEAQFIDVISSPEISPRLGKRNQPTIVFSSSGENFAGSPISLNEMMVCSSSVNQPLIYITTEPHQTQQERQQQEAPQQDDMQGPTTSTTFTRPRKSPSSPCRFPVYEDTAVHRVSPVCPSQQPDLLSTLVPSQTVDEDVSSDEGVVRDGVRHCKNILWSNIYWIHQHAPVPVVNKHKFEFKKKDSWK